ncbi:PTS sugar transporter subunit IIA [Pediococcus cellicola]|uniref:PTS EIIA type-4 domain-containing protein n=1 Tax=Pediococcus cellicola TaxID=319652 RepID=A0A0R2IKA5_9LACO|nr:PTS fructose IIA subunit [Pediococcus cellicola]KRN65054.1 hypothetical protein IV80_GL000564 [Pediococcus cellicola]GEL15859.1 PTS fructose transporter subunit IIA [Pediococcus cellicola]
MRKYIIASHGELAKGMKDTLQLFDRDLKNVEVVTAYMEKTTDIETQIQTALSEIQQDDQCIIFTDLYGGSVNQKIALSTQKMENVFVIAGFNLPIILESVLSTEPISQAYINNLLKKGREGLQQVCLEQKVDNDDQDFFE